MSSPVPTAPEAGARKHVPFVPEHMQMKEFTLRAVLLGLLMTVVLGQRMHILACGPASPSPQRIPPQ